LLVSASDSPRTFGRSAVWQGLRLVGGEADGHRLGRCHRQRFRKQRTALARGSRWSAPWADPRHVGPDKRVGNKFSQGPAPIWRLVLAILAQRPPAIGRRPCRPDQLPPRPRRPHRPPGRLREPAADRARPRGTVCYDSAGLEPRVPRLRRRPRRGAVPVKAPPPRPPCGERPTNSGGGLPAPIQVSRSAASDATPRCRARAPSTATPGWTRSLPETWNSPAR
jgi:hypothetical protein